jgi:hypothetical protein
VTTADGKLRVDPNCYMKSLLTLTLICALSGPILAQSRAALEGEHNLEDRYVLMKEKAETFNDYKVIKNSILDGVWKITMDSLQKERAALKAANSTIAQMKSEVARAEDKVKKSDASMAESEYERTHLSVFGMSMPKTLFVTVMFVLVAGLVIGLLTILASLKVLRKAAKEKDLTIYGLTSEFDEFRKKALQKEMKISRELQDERNKLAQISKA